MPCHSPVQLKLTIAHKRLLSNKQCVTLTEIIANIHAMLFTHKLINIIYANKQNIYVVTYLVKIAFYAISLA